MEPERVRTPISGSVICYQEADRIADCLRSLSFCDEVVVVDSGSTDGTGAIAAELGARVVVNTPFPGHREQKQFAIEQCRHDYVFCLDADERCTEALRVLVSSLQRNGLEAPGYEFPRHNHYLGRVVRHGLSWPDRKLRLFDRRRGRWGGRNPHDRVELMAGLSPVQLEPGIEHLSYRSFGHHLRTIDSFSRIAARAMAAEGRAANPFDLLVRPPAVFVKSLVLRLGFLDGWRGFVGAAMAAYTDWKKYWRLWRLPRSGSGA
ncbi:MAG TPA: glycosyltransferase family 2 protein [Planctomycetota bacterium]|nr:glycosyltransferase family 2 protein [Planctomycetota bacterium]